MTTVVKGVSINSTIIYRFSRVVVPLISQQPNQYTNTFLHRAWANELSAFVFWSSSIINLSPSATIPSSVVANLVNKSVII